MLQAGYERITPLMDKNIYNGLPPNIIKSPVKPELKVVPTLLQISELHIANFKKMVDKKRRSPENLKH